MASLEIPIGQRVCIPTLLLGDGRPFEGAVRASDGEILAVEIDDLNPGRIPDQINPYHVMQWDTDGASRSCPLRIQKHSPRAIVAHVAVEERRQSPRLRIEMDVTYETVAPDQIKNVAEEVMARVHTLAEPVIESLQLLRAKTDDPLAQLRQEISTLREMMGELIAKVDDLTNIVQGATPRSASPTRRPIQIQNCSSTGIGLITAEPHAQGEYLRLQITLRTSPQVTFDCMGQVVRNARLERPGADEDTMPCYDVGIHLTHIHEADREHLIQYLFKVQRRILRDRHEARLAAV